MTDKHTPGPWTIEGHPQGTGFRVADANKRSVAAFPSTSRRPDDERIANARLIAAAPELLAALKEAHRLLPSLIHTSTDIDAVELGDAIERARAAIARAEGR